MERNRNLMATAACLAFAAAAHALETPFTPFKDGHASSSTYTGTGRTLLVRAGDYKAWVAHALADDAGKGLLRARLQVYVKDVVHDGKLTAWLGSPLSTLENQTHLTDLIAKDTVGSASLSASKHIQGMVDIPLNSAFIKSVADGTFTGLVLEGGAGLDAELGALEGSHGALLFLDYKAGVEIPEKTWVDSVAKALAENHTAALRGAGGPKGDVGVTGPQGPQGSQGPNGIKGDKGDAGDSPTLFNLVLDRGQRAYYTFDIFRGLPQTTPDSSGQGNNLTLATNGLTKVEKAPGDSAIQFLGGHASAVNSQSLNPYKEITLSARVRQSVEGATDSQTVISKPGQYELAIFNKRLRARFMTVLGGYEWTGDGKVDSGWHTVQASYDGYAVRLSVDGAQTSYLRRPEGPLAADTASLYVGARASGSYGFRGMLDSVKVLSYSVGAQDSLALIPGRLTQSQLQADSVSGFDAKVNANVDNRFAAKAGLSGATFTGKVGIGTTGVPAMQLDVFGGDAIIGGATAGAARAEIGGGAYAHAGSYTYHQFRLRSNNIDRVAIDTNGRVGIGTMAPRSLLEAAGTVTAEAFTSNPNFASAVFTAEATGGRYFEARDGNQVKAFIDPVPKGNVAYFSQKVGIGDSTPAGTFVVRGGTAGSGAGLPIVLHAQKGAAGHGGDIVLNSGENGSSGSNGNIIFGTGGQMSGGTLTSAERMRINPAGLVGIGTNNPQQALHVLGNVAVHGEGFNGGTYQRLQLYADTSNGVLFDAPWKGDTMRVDVDFKWRGEANPLLHLEGHARSVGIHTANPSANLQVGDIGINDDFRSKLVVGAGTPDTIATVNIITGDGKRAFQVYDDNVPTIPRFVVMRDGNVGIGIKNPNPGYLLHVAGSTANNSGVWANLSDARLKTDVHPLSGSLEKVLALKGVSFRWKDSKEDAKYGMQRGFIAQDVRIVIPEWVRESTDGFLSLEKTGVEAILVEAIKEQQTQIKALREKVCSDDPAWSGCL